MNAAERYAIAWRHDPAKCGCRQAEVEPGCTVQIVAEIGPTIPRTDPPITAGLHFDWLKRHDAEVAATALRDVATALASSFHPSLSDADTISTLHVYADEYEKEAGL